MEESMFSIALRDADVEAGNVARKARQVKRVPFLYKSRPPGPVTSFEEVLKPEPETIHHIVDCTNQAKGILEDTFIGVEFPKLGSCIVISQVDNITGHCKLEYRSGGSLNLDCTFKFGLRFILHLADQSNRAKRYDAWGMEIDDDHHAYTEDIASASSRSGTRGFHTVTTGGLQAAFPSAESGRPRSSRRSTRSEARSKSGKALGVISSLQAITRELAKEPKHDQRLDLGKPKHNYELHNPLDAIDAPPIEAFSFIAKKMADLAIPPKREFPPDPLTMTARVSTAVSTMVAVDTAADKDKKKKKKKAIDSDEHIARGPTKPFRGRLVMSKAESSRPSSRAQSAPDDTVLGKSYDVNFWGNRYIPKTPPRYLDGTEYMNEDGSIVFTPFKEEEQQQEQRQEEQNQKAGFTGSMFSSPLISQRSPFEEQEAAAGFARSSMFSSPLMSHFTDDFSFDRSQQPQQQRQQQERQQPHQQQQQRSDEGGELLFDKFSITWIDTPESLQPQDFERMQAESILNSMSLKKQFRAIFQRFRDQVILTCREERYQQQQQQQPSTGVVVKGILAKNRTSSMSYAEQTEGDQDENHLADSSAGKLLNTAAVPSSPRQVEVEDTRPSTSLGRLLSLSSSFSPLSKTGGGSGLASLFSSPSTSNKSGIARMAPHAAPPALLSSFSRAPPLSPPLFSPPATASAAAPSTAAASVSASLSVLSSPREREKQSLSSPSLLPVSASASTTSSPIRALLAEGATSLLSKKFPPLLKPVNLFNDRQSSSTAKITNNDTVGGYDHVKGPATVSVSGVPGSLLAAAAAGDQRATTTKPSTAALDHERRLLDDDKPQVIQRPNTVAGVLRGGGGGGGDGTRPGTARSGVSFAGFVEDDAGGRLPISGDQFLAAATGTEASPADRKSGGRSSSTRNRANTAGGGGTSTRSMLSKQSKSSRISSSARSSGTGTGTGRSGISGASGISSGGGDSSLASWTAGAFDGSSLVSSESGRRLASAAAGLNRLYLAEYDEFDAQDISDDED